MIEVAAVAGIVLVEDGGRPGLMHQGVPPGGALVAELLARANAAAGNAAGEAALEVFGAVSLVSRRDGLRVATDEGVARTLERGAVWRVACDGARVRYAAVRGGLAVPKVLGGRGTLAVAGVGGHEGRPLRRGDLLPVGQSAERAGELPPRPSAAGVVRVVPGPDGRRFPRRALEALLGSEFRVSARSDRVGVRLVGPALARADADDGISSPMLRGAIQVPSSGEPIVLGPDHPTMGGYPVLATVVASDFGSLMVRPPGSAVRFTAFVTTGRGGVI